MSKARVDRTNAMRFLDSRGIAYVAHTYSPELHSADGVAEALGFPASQVFKTLVVIPETPRAKPVLAIVPGSGELDLKKLARALDEKRVRMATQREAESLTGLLVGGISALALMNKGFRVLLDASCQALERILVSAGQRGINLELATSDLIAVLQPELHDLSVSRS